MRPGKRLSYICAWLVIVSCINANQDQCRACNNGWCDCSDSSKTIQCQWATDRPIEWFAGCGDYEVLVLHPEKTYAPKSGILPKLLSDSNPNPRRSLFKEFFVGLDGLKKLIINRHCIIENGAFASLKNLEELEITWKNRAVCLKTKDQIPISGDTPILFENSLADLPYTLKLYASKSTATSLKSLKKYVKTSCAVTVVDRDFTGEKNLLYRNLEAKFPRESSAQESPSTSQRDCQLNDSHGLPSARTSTDSCMVASTSPGLEIVSKPDIQDSHAIQMRFHTMDATITESALDSLVAKAQLKRTRSVDRSHIENCDILHSTKAEANILQPVSGIGDVSNRTLGSVIERPEFARCQDLNFAARQETDDAFSHNSSEDPEFAVIEEVADINAVFAAGQGKGASYSGKPGMSSFGGGHISFPPVPLGSVSECPFDIDEMITARYLFTDDVVANIGVAPNPSMSMGRFGRSIFVEFDNWII